MWGSPWVKFGVFSTPLFFVWSKLFSAVLVEQLIRAASSAPSSYVVRSCLLILAAIKRMSVAVSEQVGPTAYMEAVRIEEERSIEKE